MEITGKLIKLLPTQSGEGKKGAWTKKDFVLETFGEYPKKVAFSSWNDKADIVMNKAIGTTLKVKFAPESREYNERWYTDLRAYLITDVNGNQTTSAASQNEAKPQQEPESEGEGDLPF